MIVYTLHYIMITFLIHLLPQSRDTQLNGNEWTKGTNSFDQGLESSVCETFMVTMVRR